MAFIGHGGVLGGVPDGEADSAEQHAQTEGTGDAAGRLAEIRAYLAAFDWERNDRQYALEKTEQVNTGGDR
jgi:hypothetical protein